MLTYKLEKEFLYLLEEPQLELFKNEFKITEKKSFIDIKFEKRGYRLVAFKMTI